MSTKNSKQDTPTKSAPLNDNSFEAPSAPGGPPPYQNEVAANSNVTLDDLLAGYQCYLLFDRSGSMSGPVSKKKFGITRWREQKEAAGAISSAIDHIDPDGATVVFFNDGISTYDGLKSEEVMELFTDLKPEGLTNLYEALAWTFNNIKRHVKKDGSYKSLIICTTDGEPYMGNGADDNEKNRVATLISNFTREMKGLGMTDDQVGVSLIQIGDDKKATTYLEFLDNNLTTKYGAVFDIVDTIKFSDVEAAGGVVQAFVRAFSD